MEDEIKAEFVQNGFSVEDEEDVLKQCTSFCINYSLKPSDLVSSWELYYLNTQLEGCKVQNSHMKGFLHYLQMEQKKAVRNQLQPDFYSYSSNNVNVSLESEAEHKEEEAQRTPAKSPWKPSTTEWLSSLAIKTPAAKNGDTSMQRLKSNATDGCSPNTRFSNRLSKFQLLSVFNPHVQISIENEGADPKSEDGSIRRAPELSALSVEIQGKPPKPGFRYMNFTIEKRFLAMERRIGNFTAALAASENRSVFHHVAVASQESVFVVGLVLCDSAGRLNDKSVLLQGSAESSGGHRVKLDLQKLTEFSLFPGQVVGIEGHNLSGHCLVASRLIDSYPVSKSPSTIVQDGPALKKMVKDHSQQIKSLERNKKKIKMLIAAGPFTTTDNLAFQPLEELLQYSQKKDINVLILMGPFVDKQHATIKDGTVDRFFEDIFFEEICMRLRDYCEHMGPNIRIVLMPSTRDVHHDFVFPQEAFDSRIFKEYGEQIICVANPALFRICDIMVGACTVDVLKHLSCEELSKNSGQGSVDRLTRLATHILKQRSFYPLFPAAPGLSLDLSASPESLNCPVDLDMLILPSDLAPFVKVLEVGDDVPTVVGIDAEQQKNHHKCVCVNPGRLAKGTLGGSFAEVFTQEKDLRSLQTEEDLSVFFDERAAISIVRI